MDQKMFCYQCQETAGCKGCTVVGVCGKQPDVAAMQDLLVWVTKGISAVTTRLREEGRAVADEVNHLVTENLFTTITNANFDKAAIEKRIEKTLEMKTALWEQLERRDNLPEAAGWTGEPSEFIKKSVGSGRSDRAERGYYFPSQLDYVWLERFVCLYPACERPAAGGPGGGCIFTAGACGDAG